ncbi:Uncharacterised protein [Mycoplasmopsis citelli]|uniref:Lipoprotein n=1 Tax=Mycoplasmopsis citelli TaxID=171281 RepID=A0A449B136_9BACT|nr:hypothetical protein [Mycoplasmopsis citelli]VEU74255.1 Uncharacterised protein [Mycoplasmopsis citelli]
MKNKFKFWLIPTIIVGSVSFNIACTSDFDNASNDNLANIKIQAQGNLQEYNRYFDAINNFFENKNPQESENFAFYYKNIQAKAQQFVNALSEFNNLIKNQNVNFKLKKEISEQFFKQLNLQENEIKSYNDAFFRFNAINEELNLLALDRVFNVETNIFLNFKKYLGFFAADPKNSPLYDEWFSKNKLSEAQEEYKNKWYNPNFKTINYAQLGKKIQVDGKSVVEHTHAIGNVVKEWSVIVGDVKNSTALQQISNLIAYLNVHEKEINNLQISNILKIINGTFEQYKNASHQITNQFADSYPSSKLVGFFDENSNFQKLFNIWEKTNELYTNLKS